ncbi:MAG: NAD-dependent epimerase/dehydratase family protein, partial [Desulfatirhabdiaceae bacterium]
CGFIGINFIQRILKEKESPQIRIVDNLCVGSRENLDRLADFREGQTVSKSVELVVGDILDSELFLDMCKGVDVVVHLAANTGVLPSIENPISDCEVNVRGTLNCLEGARLAGVKRFVFASSGAPLGHQHPPIHEKMAPRPLSPYGASKLAGEGYCSAYFGSFGLETVVLRFGNVYGPISADKFSIVAKFIKLIIAGESLPIYGDGKQTRDFIYIDDVVEAIRLGTVMPEIGGEIFQIATYRENTVLELAHCLNHLAEKHLGRKSELIHEQEKDGEIRRNYSDISKARKLLGFEPRYGLEEGLEKTFLWFLENT